MSKLEKIIFLADLLEEERCFSGVEELRALLFKDLDECLTLALQETVKYLERDKKEIYPLTREAYEFYKENGNGTKN
jgi:HD superfamily phosphohydrolase YqeK